MWNTPRIIICYRKCHRVLPSVPNGTWVPKPKVGEGSKNMCIRHPKKKHCTGDQASIWCIQKKCALGTTDVATVGAEHSWALTCLWCSRRFGTGTSVWFPAAHWTWKSLIASLVSVLRPKNGVWNLKVALTWRISVVFAICWSYKL